MVYRKVSGFERLSMISVDLVIWVFGDVELERRRGNGSVRIDDKILVGCGAVRSQLTMVLYPHDLVPHGGVPAWPCPAWSCITILHTTNNLKLHIFPTTLVVEVMQSVCCV